MLIDACMTNCTSWFQPSAWFILCMLFIKHQILSFHINPPMSNLWLPHGLGYKSCCAPEREIRQYIYIIKYYRREIIPRWTVICGSDSSGEWTAPASGVKLLLLWGVSHRGSEQHLLLEWIHSTVESLHWSDSSEEWTALVCGVKSLLSFCSVRIHLVSDGGGGNQFVIPMIDHIFRKQALNKHTSRDTLEILWSVLFKKFTMTSMSSRCLLSDSDFSHLSGSSMAV